MKNLKDSIFSKYQDKPKNFNIATERIKYQNDPVFKNKFENLLEDLILETFNYIDKFKFNVATSVKPIIKSIEDLLFDRFNIRFKFTLSTDSNACCVVIPPLKNSAINNDVIDVYSNVKNKVTESNKILPDTTSFEEIWYSKNFSKYYVEAHNAITESLEYGLTIDYNNAKIYGLPNNYEVLMAIDVYGLVKIFKKEVRKEQFAGVLLHEIGHVFTHIEYSYTNAAYTLDLLDSIKTASDKNYSREQALLILGEKLTNDPDFKKNNEGKTILKVVTNIASGILDYTEVRASNLASTNSEQKADEFACMFGYGSEIIDFLKIYNKFFSRTILRLLGFASIRNIISVSKIIILLVAGQTLAAFGSILFLFLTRFVTTMIVVILSGGGTEKEMTYDNILRRYERIKLNMIRQLRSNEYPEDIKKQIFDEINKIDKSIKGVVDEKMYGTLDKIWHALSSSAKNRRNERNVERLIQDLLDNNLYVSSFKLNQVIKEKVNDK